MEKVPKAKCWKCAHCEKIIGYASHNEVKCDAYRTGLTYYTQIPLYCRHFKKITKGGSDDKN
jgi:hypothetical protein